MDLDTRVALAAVYKQRLELTNIEIADALRVDVSSVSRYLKEAERREWLVKKLALELPKSINQTIRKYLRQPHIECELLTEVKNLSGTRAQIHEFVVAGERLPIGDFQLLGLLGADWLADVMAGEVTPKVLGISWGRSTYALVSALHQFPLMDLPDVEIAPLQGGVGMSQSNCNAGEYFADMLANDLSRFFQSKANALRLPFPAYVDAFTESKCGEKEYAAILDFIHNEPSFGRLQSLYDQLDVGIVGIGALEPNAWALTSGYLPDSELVPQLKAAGVCGDIVCRFFRRECEAPIEAPVRGKGHTRSKATQVDRLIYSVNRRAIGISLSQLQSRVKAGARILAIAGSGNGDKAEAILGAIVNGFVSDVVTDSTTAEHILKGLRSFA